MGIVEGFATFALENDVEEDNYDYQLKFLGLVILMKILMFRWKALHKFYQNF